jgi:general secretion pathway protein D
MLLGFIVSACKTIEDGPAMNAWTASAPAQRPAPFEGRRALDGAPVLASGRGGEPTIVEGTGRFVGDPPTGSVKRSVETQDDGVTINLVNVPAAQAAKTILGDILSVRYSVDPTVEGRLTIQTPKPVSTSAALDLFQAALRSNNAALVNTRGVYRIVPADQAAVGAKLRVPGEADLSEPVGVGLQVVQLKYVAASEMRRVLEPIAPRGGIVRVDDPRNLITLSGSREEVASMMEAISLFDVDVMKGMSFALVPLKTSQPDAIAGELRTIFSSDREGPLAGMVQFLPNRRLGAVLVVSAQPKYLTRAEEWIRRLDKQAQGGEKQLFTYSVQNRRAEELVGVLQSMFANETTGRSSSTPTKNVAPPYQESNLQTASISQSGGKQGGGTGSSFGGSSAQGGIVQARFPQNAPTAASSRPNTAQLGADDGADGPRIRVVADQAKNAILIEARPDDYRRLLRVVSVLDVLPKQVLIEATIAEVTLNDDLKFGLRWALRGKHDEFDFTDAASGAVNSVFPGFSYALTASNIAASLNALSQVTDVNIISSPSLTVMDNRSAVLQIGDQVPITTQSAVSVLGVGTPIVNSISYRDTGVILALTPQINESGRVMLDVEQEVSSVANTTSSTIDSPTIRQRRIRTSVALNNGEALVLGGLMQDSKTVSRTQVPIFGDLPLVGNAFKNKDNQVSKTELIIIIAPHVMRNVDEARRITDEFRRDMGLYARRDHARQRSLETTVKRVFD